MQKTCPPSTVVEPDGEPLVTVLTTPGAAEHEHACKRRARKRDPERLRTRMILLGLCILLRGVRLRVVRTRRLRIGRRGIDGRRGIRPRHTTRPAPW